MAFGSQWGIRIENWSFINFNQIISFSINPTANIILSDLMKENLVVMLISLFYFIWNQRNETLFKAQSVSCQASNKLSCMVKEYWNFRDVEETGRVEGHAFQLWTRGE